MGHTHSNKKKKKKKKRDSVIWKYDVYLYRSHQREAARTFHKSDEVLFNDVWKWSDIGRALRPTRRQRPTRRKCCLLLYFLLLLLLSRLLYTSIHTRIQHACIFSYISLLYYYHSLFFSVRFSMERINNPPTQVFFFLSSPFDSITHMFIKPPSPNGILFSFFFFIFLYPQWKWWFTWNVSWLDVMDVYLHYLLKR